MSSVAVVLRGHLRTWNYCKQHLFKLIDSEYSHVDWYMVTWRESINDNRLQHLYDDFQNRNFTLKIIEECSSNYTPWTVMGRLCMEVVEEITTKKYSTIVETRPDTYAVLSDDVHLPRVEPNSFYTTGYTLHHRDEYKTGAHDWFLMYDYHLFELYAKQRLNTIYVPHVGMVEIARQHDVALHSLPNPGLYTDLLRPTVHDFGSLDPGHSHNWYIWDDNKRIELLNRLDIAVEDYLTGGVAALNKAACFV